MKASSVQDAFRAIPAPIAGTDAADLLHDYATQLRNAANNAPDGIFQKTYGIDGALKAADQIDAAGSRFRLLVLIQYWSNDYNELKLMVGKAVQEMYAIQGQLEVFNVAENQLVQDLKDNAKIAGAGLGVVAIVAIVIAAIVFLRPVSV